jgi:hypothetical protein
VPRAERGGRRAAVDARRPERPGPGRHQVRRPNAAGRPARTRRARRRHVWTPDVDRRLDPRGRRTSASRRCFPTR